MTIKKILIALLFYLSMSTPSTFGQNRTTKIASGVWSTTIGTPEKFNLTSHLEFSPRIDAINDMGECAPPSSLNTFTSIIKDGKVYLSFPLEKEEKIFGLGLNFKTIEQRGRIMRLHVDHYDGRDNGRTHAPVPFFVSSLGYGVFINSARYIDVWVGTAVKKDSPNAPEEQDRNTDKNWEAQPYSDNIAILIPAEGVEITTFAGNNMLDVVRRYNLFMGGGTLPPRWGLGFWHRVPTWFTDKEVEEEVKEFEERKFPLSVIGLEPGWMSKSYPCTNEWDQERFPHPEDFVNNMSERDIKLNLWINPYISKHSEVYSDIKPLTADYTVWNGVIPDYSMKEARQKITNHFTKHTVELGISGYKIDENDGYDSWLWPDIALFPSGNSAEQIRQTYGSIMQSFTTSMYRKNNKRTYGLVRAGNAGTSSFPYVLYNDYYNHRDFITALINSSFIGVLWTPEVRSSKTAEEWIRRMQTVCFSPVAMLNAWADGTKPWSFKEVEKEVKEIAELRTQLIPYLYTNYADYYFYGTPPVRAMNLEESYTYQSEEISGILDGTDNPYVMATRKENKDQFMVGDYLMVAPLFSGEKKRNVILPQGNWYDFYTGKYVGNGETIEVSPGLSKIPLFVKDGGIIPMYVEPLKKLSNTKRDIIIKYYGEKPSTFNLYDDDGETFDYESGNYSRIPLTVTINKKGSPIGKVNIDKETKIWSFAKFFFKYMSAK